MKIDELRTYKKILILGYGLEGKASERFIRKFHPDAHIGFADQKDDPHYLDVQDDYDLAIRTPLLRPDHIRIPYTTGTNLFFANVTNPIIGITGTKGKSTTVSLLNHVLQIAGKKSRLYGNIGEPMLEALNEGVQPDDIFILELSSYQLEDIHYSPHIACILNIYKELHNHPSYENYYESKSHITTYQSSNDYLFYNGLLPETAQLATRTQAQTMDFTTFHIEELVPELRYTTHLDNLKAVYAIASHLGVKDDQFTAALQSFKPLEHRLQHIGRYNDIEFYDDSGSVHPSATILALNSLENVGSILLGGQDRGYEFTELVALLAKKNLQTIFLFPETQQKIYNEIQALEGYNPKVIMCTNMEEAVKAAFELTLPNSICLLSPGAPSYLMYKNLSERGDDFSQLIQKYGKASKTENNEKATHEQSSGSRTS